MFRIAKAILEDNEGIRPVIPPPDDPEPVAQEEAPKPDLPPTFGLGSNEPRGDYRDNHRGPLEERQRVHSFD